MAVQTFFTFPHVPQNLNVTRDLLFRTFYPLVFEVIDKKLVAPSAATPGIGGPRRLPVLPKPCDDGHVKIRRASDDGGIVSPSTKIFSTLSGHTSLVPSLSIFLCFR